MSSAVSIASVTAVLKDLLENQLIQQGVADQLGDVSVTALPPDRVPVGSEERPQINVFLYRVVPVSSWNRSAIANGHNTEQPRTIPIALDLHYLVSAYGEQEFEAEILLGHAIQVFHESTILSNELIEASTGSGSAPARSASPARAALRASNLRNATEPIRIEPEFISTDDSSRLWAAFQARFRPSVSYRVSYVVIGTDV